MANTEYWHKAPKGSAHSRVWELLSRLQLEQSRIQAQNEAHYSLYSNRPYHSLIPGSHDPPPRTDNDITLNVVQSCVDTLHSKICVHRPRPMAMTAAGSAKLTRRAKGLQKFIDGVFYGSKLYSKTPRAFVDGAIFGTGLVKVYGDPEGGICCERVFPNEIIVDEQAALTDEPRSLFQRKWLDLEVVRGMFPKATLAPGSADAVAGDSTGTITELCEVVEAWHLPSSPGAKDGRHVICVNGEDLLDEPWKHSRFPFAVFRWSQRALGWWGQGLVEQLEGIQREINRLVQFIRASHKLLSAAKVFVQKGTKLKNEHMTNRIGEIIWYEGSTPPQIAAQPTVHPEIYGHLWQLYQRAYEISGVSQLSAQSKKPSGELSGVALRTLIDAETQRFAQLVRQWEDFHLDIAELVVMVAKEMDEEDELEVTFRSSMFIERVKWADVDMERDEFELQVWPTSMLPMQPEGRLQAVLDMLQGQLLGPQEGRKLLNWPDLQKTNELDTAPADLMGEIFESMLDGGEYVPPMENFPLDEAVVLAQKYYMRARINGFSEEQLADLLLWIDQANALRARAMQGAQQMQAMQQAQMQPQQAPPGNGVS